MNPNIFDTLLDAVLIVDSEQKIHYCNPVVGTLLNAPVVRLMKTKSPLSSVITFNEEPFDLTNLKRIAAPTPYIEVDYKTNSGKQGKVGVTVQPFYENESANPDRWVIFMRDVALEESLQKKYRGELEKKEHFIKELQTAQEQLKDYAENLEEKVTERTAELASANRTMDAMMNSLGQGFAMFDSSGMCLSVVSKACLTLLECNPAKKPIWEVLKVPSEKIEAFKKWCHALFEDRLIFEDMVNIAPKLFSHSKGHSVTLEYQPIRNEEGKLINVVLVATDKTNELEAIRRAELETTLAHRVIKITKSRDQFWRFVGDSQNNLAHILHHLRTSPVPDINSIYRLIHTLKGDAGVFYVTPVIEKAHEFETELDRLRNLPDEQKKNLLSEIGKKVTDLHATLEHFLEENRDFVGEDSKSQSRRQVSIFYQDLYAFHAMLLKDPKLAQMSRMFEEYFLKEPVKKFVTQYGDLITEMAKRTFKSVKPLKILGGDIKVVGRRYSPLFSTFVHLVRNSLDHGIESTNERKAANKTEQGRVEITFSRITKNEKPWIRILFSDDGRGIDPVVIRQKLIEKKVPFDKNETDTEIIQHVFDKGFSTALGITEFSGRGMGMDALKDEVLKMGGNVVVQSKKGAGTQVVIEVPEFTLQETSYTLPQAS